MKQECINQKLNDIIKSHIPEGIKPMPYLMDLLQLSRESVYRRLRGEISYTIQEGVLLASALNISFDELFDNINNKENVYINFNTAKTILPEDNYVEMMKSTIKVFDNISEGQYSKVFYAGNKILNSLLINYKTLSKLRYIRWIHQTHNLPIDSKFSEIILPPKVIEVHKEYAEIAKRIDQMTVIFDSYAVLAIINTIKFYYRRNLITKAELLEMKKELLAMAYRFEEIARSGKNSYNMDTFLYLSDLNIESNIMLFEFEDKVSTHVLSSGKFPLVSSNVKIYDEQKMWIDSLLKFSVLVTRSNELVRAEFATKQIDLIEVELNSLL